MIKIVILDSKTFGKDMDLSLFNRIGSVDIYETTTREEVLKRVEGKDIVVTNKVVFDQDILRNSATKNLKLICIAATGTNNVDLDCARERKIAVTNVAGYSTESVVQHTFSMLFYLLEKLRYYDEYVKSGQYIHSDIFTHLDQPFYEIYKKKWGIIGLGAIGKRVAEIAKAFGVEVMYYSTSGKNKNVDYKQVSLDQLLDSCEIISIHAPLNEKTKNLIAYEELKKMKKNSILINVGRGGIVNEKDLAQALEEKLIAGAALDVLEREPILEENPLIHIKNKDMLFITPHIAWGSIEARSKLISEIIQNIEDFLQGKTRNRIV